MIRIGTSDPPSKGRATSTRRAAILAAAADLIIERGYDGTNLDAICERANCSKSSIYGYFDNKEGLLAALTEEIALDLSPALHALHRQRLSVDEALQRYARLALKSILSERHIAIVRAIISAVWKHPGLGLAYYEVGALTAQSALAQYFARQSRDGVLNIADAQWAAKEFQGLLLWDWMMARILGTRGCPDDAEIAAQADAAVAAFLGRYQGLR